MERIARERWSSSAQWSWRIAIVGALVTVYGVVFHRYDMIDTPSAFALLCGGLSVAFIALCLGVFAMVTTWVRVVRGFRYAIGATALATAVLGPTAYYVVPGMTVPAINDISTDLEDPPLFAASVMNRPDWANDLEPPDPESAEAAAQREAYPDLAPLILEMQPEEGFDFALRAVNELGWSITSSIEPPVPDAEGQIEAVARTDIVGYRDDVVIRVRPIGWFTRFDVRSVSRYGRSDLGRNAQRIRETLATIERFSLE